jgi:hypothetical protein
MSNLCHEQIEKFTEIIVIFHNKNFLHWTFRKVVDWILVPACSVWGCPPLITRNGPASYIMSFAEGEVLLIQVQPPGYHVEAFQGGYCLPT